MHHDTSACTTFTTTVGCTTVTTTAGCTTVTTAGCTTVAIAGCLFDFNPQSVDAHDGDDGPVNEDNVEEAEFEDTEFSHFVL
ncbi:hypothetical protein L6452_19682 [Arctium lappa]|uniref:Uncharacterized protein n=1 Tax=Arctium lappa TaxID=4217 RepID=A0ACB9B9M9_ARCLA|nr:hypothetical protein L6452_19682 [Arctium lappa]